MSLQIALMLPSGTAARLLQRLEGGAAAHPAAAAPAAPAVDDAARQRSRAHLQKALVANAKLRLAPHQAAVAAQVCAVHQQQIPAL
jgi:regulator of protease activity HflC (stomatin/prohibitin superfamily)